MLHWIFLLTVPALFAGPVSETLSESMGKLHLEWDEVKAAAPVNKNYSTESDCKVRAKVAGYDHPDSIERTLSARKDVYVGSSAEPGEEFDRCKTFARETFAPLAKALSASSLLQSGLRASQDDDETFFDHVKVCYYDDVVVSYLPSDSNTWEIKGFTTVKRIVPCP
ncbi:hypothetical protein K2X33_15340 [bacterium]|nr:hypothetical protein [bacterium]